MKLRFKVDQANSFRMGINAETSIVDLDVDPARQEQYARDLISRHLQKGIEVHQFSFPGGLIEASAPTVTALIMALQADEASAAKEKAAAIEREAKEKAEKEERIKECRAAFAERKVKTSRNVSGVEYSFLEPDLNKHLARELKMDGYEEWARELDQQKSKIMVEAIEAEEVKLKAKDQEEQDDLLKKARFAGVEAAWVKGYITKLGVSEAFADVIRKKHNVDFEEGELSTKGPFNLTLEEIKAAEMFRAKLPKDAEFALTGESSYPNKIVAIATWQEQGETIPASTVIREGETIPASTVDTR